MVGSATVLVWGTEEQKERFLRPIFTGLVRTWQLLTEPEAGSDLAGVQLSARRDGDEYVLNGQKIFVGSAHGADRFWMITRDGMAVAMPSRGAAAPQFSINPDAVVVSEQRDRILTPGDDEIGWTAKRGRIPLGYLDDPDKTADTFVRVEGDRVVVPGDRGRLAADGSVVLLGRDSTVVGIRRPLQGAAGRALL